MGGALLTKSKICFSGLQPTIQETFMIHWLFQKPKQKEKQTNTTIGIRNFRIWQLKFVICADTDPFTIRPEVVFYFKYSLTIILRKSSSSNGRMISIAVTKLSELRQMKIDKRVEIYLLSYLFNGL